MKFFPAVVLCAAVSLSACGEKPATTATTTLGAETLPADAPVIGTDIKDVVKPAESTANTSQAKSVENVESADNAEVSKIMWDDLIPEDFQPDAIMAKYQSQIDNIEEGSPEEMELFTKIKNEFNSAPTNQTLASKTVKIPGFVSPLDESNGMVGEFLLVPYFGSCIHSPPPPINQTVLVKPQEGKSISMKDIYQPVWVIGEMKVEAITTDLAQAGYQIENARLEKYEAEDETAAQNL